MTGPDRNSQKAPFPFEPSGKGCIVGLAVLVSAMLLLAADWPMQNGNSERNGWAKSEHLITPQNVAHLELLYKYKVEGQPDGLYSLTAPIINGNLITYRGFKEMLIFGSSSGTIFSVDADLNKLIWKTHFAETAQKPATNDSGSCPSGLNAPVFMAGSSASSMRFAVRAAHTPAGAAPPPRRSPYFPPLSQTIFPLRPTTLSELSAMYAVTIDGKLHIVNSSTGDDLLPPFKFLPPNARVTGLNIHENIVYATTADSCDGFRNSLYAIDLLNTQHPGTTYPLRFGRFGGTAGTAIGNDGTLYFEAAYGEGDSLKGYRDGIIALDPRNLSVKDFFLTDDKPISEKSLGERGITPMVFSYGGRDVVVAGGHNGRIYLLDSRSLGGSDHKTALFESEPFASSEKNYDGNGFQGTFSSWHDVDSQTRWIYAPLSGPPRDETQFPSTSALPRTGSIVAFRVDWNGDKPKLRPLWISSDIASPGPTVVGNRMVFVLSTGISPRRAKKNGEAYTMPEIQSMATHASLHVLDAFTGKELYSSGNSITGYARAGALAVANGRVYLTTQDKNVYSFGFLRGQPQLSER